MSWISEDLPIKAITCDAAVAPLTIVDKQIFDSTTDGTTATVIGPVASGDPAFYGGVFNNSGCVPLLLEITYLEGGNCEACDDPDVLTTVVKDWVIDPNKREAIPDGFWTQISYVLETAANDAKKQIVGFKSCHKVDCPDCLVIVP